MKSAEALREIAQKIEAIVRKPENIKDINKDDTKALLQEIEAAGNQFFDLPFEENLLSFAAKNQNMDLILLLKNHYTIQVTDLTAEPALKLDQVLEAIHAAPAQNKAALSILEDFLLGNNSIADPLVIASTSKNIALLKKLIPAYVKLSKKQPSMVYARCVKAIEKINADIVKIFREYPEFLVIKDNSSSKSKTSIPIGQLICLAVSDNAEKAYEAAKLAEAERIEKENQESERVEEERRAAKLKKADELKTEQRIASEKKQREEQEKQQKLIQERLEAMTRKLQNEPRLIQCTTTSTTSDLRSQTTRQNIVYEEITRKPEYEFPYSASSFGWGILAGVGIVEALALSLCVADQVTDKKMLSNTFNSITHWMWESICGQSCEPNAGQVTSMVLLGGSVFGLVAGGMGMILGGKKPRAD